MSNQNVSQQVLEFLTSVTGETDLTLTSDLQESGIIDSLTMMDLLVFVESQFQVRLGFADLRPEVFASIETLSALIVEKQQGSERQQAA
jgi:acyl carrier protein